MFHIKTKVRGSATLLPLMIVIIKGIFGDI